jgi:hypothetical protein
LRYFTRARAPLVGVEVGVVHLAWPGLGWSLTVDGAQGSLQVEQGHATAATLAGAATLLAWLRWSDVAATAGLGARSGYAFMAGTARPGAGATIRAGRLQGPWNAAMARLGLQARPLHSLVLFLSIEAGVVLQGLVGRAGSQAVWPVRHGYGSASVGIGWSL